MVFNLTKGRRLFLEYDDERRAVRAHGSSPAAEICSGLLTTKRGQMEPRDEILRRIDEAAKFVDIDQLCLSPQCGFSSNAIGNLISVEEQKAKLGAIVDIAKEVWG